MSLQQVLTNLSNARGGIVSALSGRGLTVSSSTTLTGAATVISTLPMSGSVDVSDTTAEPANVQSGYYYYDSSGNKVSGTLNVTSSGGTDVSDTTATAGDVLSGAYFYTSAGTKTQGTIPSLSSQTITPGTSAQVISGGQYLAGDQTIAGDADLIASNIKSGVTIFGVAGSLDVSSGGVDVSDTTATAGSVLSGAYFYDSTGTKTQGTIPTVSASQSANVVTIPAGYHANSQTVTVGSAVQSQTITPGTTAQVLSSGGYLVGDVTIAGDAALVSANIASGVTIFGVTGSHVGGTDVSDTTATAGSVLSGSYFYDSSGTKTQGTIPSLASQTITPGTSAQVISAGQYLSGAQTIAGDAALIASNIVSGATIFGVAGSAMTSGGVDVSDTTAQAANVQSGYYFYTSGGVRTSGTLVPTEFYKCATVDSTNHTWTGYKAVLNQDGYYEYESAATAGLLYDTAKTTPVVDKAYSDGCLIEAKLYENPADGLVFYAPLTSSIAADIGGSATVVRGSTPSFQTVGGISALRCTGDTGIDYDATDYLPNGNNPRSMSFWVYVVSGELSSSQFACGYGSDNNNAFQFAIIGSYPSIYRPYQPSNANMTMDQWVHFVMTFDGSESKLYRNGTLDVSKSGTINTIRDKVFVGYHRPQLAYPDPFKGYITHLRIFNKAISDSAIQMLYSELNS